MSPKVCGRKVAPDATLMPQNSRDSPPKDSGLRAWVLQLTRAPAWALGYGTWNCGMRSPEKVQRSS